MPWHRQAAIGLGGWVRNCRSSSGSVSAAVNGVGFHVDEGETLTVRVAEGVASGAEGVVDHVTTVAFVGDGTRRTMESFDLYGGRRLDISVYRSGD